MINNQNRFQIFPFLLTEIGLMSIFLLLLLIGAFKKDTIKVKKIISNRNISWKSEQDPIVLMQLTDTHLNDKSKGHIKARQFQTALNQSTTIYNPSLIILSGDLVDNKDQTKGDIGYGEQHRNDYILYHQILDSVKNFDKSKLIDIAGNHDEYGVGSFDSDNHNIINYSIYYSKLFENSKDIEKFWISRKETDEIELFSISPYWHPVPHAKLAFNIFPTAKFLDVVEKKLSEIPKSDKPRIVQCHFPLNLWIGTNLVKTSKTKKTIFDILEQSNITIFLTGHWHPYNRIISHHDGFLEIVCSDLTTNKRFGLITIDNSRLVFHDMAIEHPMKFLITHPIPKNQLSPQSVFNDKNTEIRVLAFTDSDDHQFTATITSDDKKISEKVELKFAKTTKSGHKLYSAPLPESLEFDSAYHISLSGDLVGSSQDELNESEFDFFIGNSIELPPEDNFFRPSYKVIVYITLVFLWVLMFIVTFPFSRITEKINKKLKVTELNEWIFGNDSMEFSSIQYLINSVKSIFLGPFSMNERLNNLPLSLRIYLFCIVLYPLFLPVSFIKVEKFVGIIWTYGYVLNGKATIDLWGVKYSAFYVSVFLMPTVLFFSTFASAFPVLLTSLKSNFSLKTKIVKCAIVSIFNLLLFFLGCGSIFFVCYYFLIEAVGFTLAALSPMYILIPVASLIWAFVYIGKLMCGKGELENNLGESLLDKQKLINSQL